MRLSTIQIHDSEPTCLELEREYPDLWRAVQAMPGVTGWCNLQRLLTAERKRAREALLLAIMNAMQEATKEVQR